MASALTILGCRGSIPSSGAEYIKYGTATSCYALRMGSRLIFIDAGSGLLNSEKLLLSQQKSIDLLITHAHADHIMGLAMCKASFDENFNFNIYLKTRQGLDAKQQLDAYFKRPSWPVGLEALPANFSFNELTETFSLGPISVKTMEGCHPGGSSLISLSDGERDVAIATDCVINKENWDRELRFFHGADLLLIDGQYSQSEFDKNPGFGHNSWLMAAEFAKACRVKQALLIHHDPFRTDAQLDAAEIELKKVFAKASFAKEGQIIVF